MNICKIMIVDDHQMMIDGLQMLLGGEADLEVVATAQRGRQALQVLSEISIDLLIVDMSMPEMPGYELVRLAREQVPEIKVLVLSMFDDRRMIRMALMAGADGYVLKGSGRRELLTAIRRIVDDDVYYCGEVAGKLLEDYVQSQHGPDGPVLHAHDLERMRQEDLSGRSNGQKTSEDEVSEVYERLKYHFSTARPYLDRALTLPKLAEQLHVPPHKLSLVINQTEKRHFAGFVNSFRVKEAQRLLRDPGSSHKTIEAIGYEAGFNNKVTFIDAFKKECGFTPGQFKKQEAEAKQP